jgi:hypothetical protein
MFAPDLAAILRASGYTIVGLDDRPPPNRHSDGTCAEALLAAFGPERTDAVYRAVSRVLHPDVATGDATLQRQLNAAREGLRR